MSIIRTDYNGASVFGDIQLIDNDGGERDKTYWGHGFNWCVEALRYRFIFHKPCVITVCSRMVFFAPCFSFHSISLRDEWIKRNDRAYRWALNLSRTALNGIFFSGITNQLKINRPVTSTYSQAHGLLSRGFSVVSCYLETQWSRARDIFPPQHLFPYDRMHLSDIISAGPPFKTGLSRYKSNLRRDAARRVLLRVVYFYLFSRSTQRRISKQIRRITRVSDVG